MAGEKRFGISIFGFRKSDVNAYIEKIIGEFNEKLREKEEEASSYKNLYNDVKSKYEEYLQKTDGLVDNKSKIADVLIKAQEQAQSMIENAQKQNEEERKKVDELIEQEKERLVAMKHQLKSLREEIIGMLKQYELQITTVIKKSDQTDNTMNDNEPVIDINAVTDKDASA